MIFKRPNEIIKICLEYYGFDFKTKCQKQRIVEARRMVTALLSEHTTLTSERIGDMLNYKRSATCHARARLYDDLQYDQRIIDDYNSLKLQINEL